MELRCNSSDSSTNSNACLTPGPPCCEMYSSRFASAARFTTTHLRNGGIVRAMCHNASIGVFGSLADCGVSARGGGGGCSRPLFGVCAVCSVLANRFALLRRRGACDAVRDAACLRRAARSGMPARRAGMHGLCARAWGSASIISFPFFHCFPRSGDAFELRQHLAGLRQIAQMRAFLENRLTVDQRELVMLHEPSNDRLHVARMRVVPAEIHGTRRDRPARRAHAGRPSGTWPDRRPFAMVS